MKVNTVEQNWVNNMNNIAQIASSIIDNQHALITDVSELVDFSNWMKTDDAKKMYAIEIEHDIVIILGKIIKSFTEPTDLFTLELIGVTNKVQQHNTQVIAALHKQQRAQNSAYYAAVTANYIHNHPFILKLKGAY